LGHQVQWDADKIDKFITVEMLLTKTETNSTPSPVTENKSNEEVEEELDDLPELI
jgi:hypothetical protein